MATLMAKEGLLKIAKRGTFKRNLLLLGRSSELSLRACLAYNLMMLLQWYMWDGFTMKQVHFASKRT